LSTFHTRVDYQSVRHFTTVKNRTKISKNAGNHARNSPFPLRHVNFHLTHECLGPPHSSRQTASGSNQPFCHCSHVRTDRWDKQKFNHMSSPLYRERRANKSELLQSTSNVLCIIILYVSYTTCSHIGQSTQTHNIIIINSTKHTLSSMIVYFITMIPDCSTTFTVIVLFVNMSFLIFVTHCECQC